MKNPVVMRNNVCYSFLRKFAGNNRKIEELYPDVIIEDLNYEPKAI